MTTPNIDTDQTTKVNRFATIWPLFLSGLILTISGIFCLVNLLMFPGVSDQDFAILAAHSNLITFFWNNYLDIDWYRFCNNCANDSR